MTTSLLSTPATTSPVTATSEPYLARISAKFGLAFTACQIAVMMVMTAVVLPNGGSPDDPPLARGRGVFGAETAYRVGNYTFMVAGILLIGFLGVVHQRMRRADSTGVLATVGIVSGTLLALIWPLGAALHDVALDTAAAGTDLRILAGWDSVAPFLLAFSALVRVFFVGAITMGLDRARPARRLRRIGLALVPLSLVGSATLLTGALFPVLALSTLGYELWVGAVAWHWLRNP